MTGTPYVACELGATLGEGPVWDEARGCLWFVDIKGHALHRFVPGSDIVDTVAAPEEACWVFPLDDGALLVGAKAGVHRFDVEAQAFELLYEIEGDVPGNRLNDAAVHPDGSVWFGTMDNGEEAVTGRYYRLNDGACEALSPEAVIITNGPAFSPYGTVAYLVDTLGRKILAAPVGTDGVPGEPRLFAQLPDDMGHPDGPVVDSDGVVWVGLFGGWGVARFSPDGKFLGKIDFPVANVTKITFGGDDLRTVYATTARKGLSADELARQPDAGHLFAFAVDVPGLPANRPTI